MVNLKKTLGRLMQERMQRQFVMHMRPPHVATTKGESVQVQKEDTSAAQTTLSNKEKEAIAALSSAKVIQQPAPKAKGVIISEPTSKQLKLTEKDQEAAKGKGKEIMTEDERPLKRKTHIELDEELAKKLQEEELAQIEAEKAATALKTQRAQAKKRKPSIKKVKQDERRKMVTFLKSALNVNVKRLSAMSYQNWRVCIRRR